MTTTMPLVYCKQWWMETTSRHLLSCACFSSSFLSFFIDGGITFRNVKKWWKYLGVGVEGDAGGKEVESGADDPYLGYRKCIKPRPPSSCVVALDGGTCLNPDPPPPVWWCWMVVLV